jgi:colanic acid/amylovoran biosynthesis glycosyltransferase
MKIAYVSSGLGTTFVVNEMDAHQSADWKVLPIISRKSDDKTKMSILMNKWMEQSVYRPNGFILICYMLKEFMFNFRNTCRGLLFLYRLFFQDTLEFFKGIYELFTAPYFAYRCRIFGVEHIHVHFASRSLTLGILISILNEMPVSCTVHAFDIFTRSEQSLKYRLQRCSFIASISQYNIEYLRQICGDEIADKCRIVRCGIDVGKFQSLPRTHVQNTLLCIANLVTKKGYETAIRACFILKNRGLNFKFHIIGDGPLRGRLESLIENYGLNENVILHGHIPNDKLKAFFSETAAFVMPCTIDHSGDRDGIPVAFMESLACQVPVISTWVSGIPELVKHGEAGILVPERSIDSLADAIESILNNREKAEQMGKFGREVVLREYDILKTSSVLRHLIVKHI